MDSVARSDVFFTVTTAVVIIVAILIAVALVYAIRILRDAREVTKKVRDEAGHIADDVGTLRSAIADEAKKLRGFTDDLAKKFAQGSGPPGPITAEAKDVTNDNHSHNGKKKERKSV